MMLRSPAQAVPLTEKEVDAFWSIVERIFMPGVPANQTEVILDYLKANGPCRPNNEGLCIAFSKVYGGMSQPHIRLSTALKILFDKKLVKRKKINLEPRSGKQRPKKSHLYYI